MTLLTKCVSCTFLESNLNLFDKLRHQEDTNKNDETCPVHEKNCRLLWLHRCTNLRLAFCYWFQRNVSLETRCLPPPQYFEPPKSTDHANNDNNYEKKNITIIVAKLLKISENKHVPKSLFILLKDSQIKKFAIFTIFMFTFIFRPIHTGNTVSQSGSTKVNCSILVL